MSASLIRDLISISEADPLLYTTRIPSSNSRNLFQINYPYNVSKSIKLTKVVLDSNMSKRREETGMS